MNVDLWKINLLLCQTRPAPSLFLHVCIHTCIILAFLLLVLPGDFCLRMLPYESSEKSTFSGINIAKWSGVGDIVLIQYYHLIYSPYSNFINDILYSNFHSNQAHILILCLVLMPLLSQLPLTSLVPLPYQTSVSRTVSLSRRLTRSDADWLDDYPRNHSWFPPAQESLVWELESHSSMRCV